MQHRSYLPLSLLLLAAGCGDASASSTTKPAEQPPIPVTTVEANAATMPNTLELDGTLEATRRASLSPLVSGHVAEVHVERGAVVAEGDPLITLRGQDFRLAARAASARAAAQLEQLGVEEPSDEVDLENVPDVAAANADWAAAKDRLSRLEPLAGSGAVDAQSVEQARSAEAAARARYEAARGRVQSSLSTYNALVAEAALRRDDASNAVVRAPFAGAVVTRRAEVGEYVGPTTTVIELVDASELRLALQVPERFAGKVQEGQKVDIQVDGTDQRLEGAVRFVSAALDPSTRTLTIEAVAPNPDGSVRAGHFARARLELDGQRDVVRVPADAIRRRAGVSRVYVAEGTLAEARIVEVVLERDGEALVEGDLRAGERIVTAPPRQLSDGASIRAERAPGQVSADVPEAPAEQRDSDATKG